MNCKVIPIDLKLRREFIVSRGRASIRRNFIFEIEDIGLGEAAGSMHYGVSSGQIEDDLIRLKAAISRIDTDDLPDFLRAGPLRLINRLA
jgi:hypothetical protein